MKYIVNISREIQNFLIYLSGCVPEEVCFGSTFSPRCGSREVIAVTTAEYGRMDLGQCVQSEFQLGCQADARQVLDRLCSGRSSCSIDVDQRNVDLSDINNCSPDVMSYLKVDYHCVQGEYTVISRDYILYTTTVH